MPESADIVLQLSTYSVGHVFEFSKRVSVVPEACGPALFRPT